MKKYSSRITTKTLESYVFSIASPFLVEWPAHVLLVSKIKYFPYNTQIPGAPTRKGRLHEGRRLFESIHVGRFNC